MTYTSLATPVPNTPILVSSFGALVKQNLDDLDGRVTAVAANLGTWSGGTAISRILQLETSHSIRYETTAATTCGNNVDTDIPFGTAVRTDTSVFTVSGVNFTCVKSGWVDASTSMRLAAGALAFELKIKLNGTLVGGNTGGSTLQSAVATGFPVSAGDVIKVSVYHSTGSSRNLETGAGRMNHVALRWRGI